MFTTPKYFFLFKILSCAQRGRVSNKRPWLQAATRHGPGILNDKLPKIEKHGPTIGPVLLGQGEPGTSQYIT